MTDCLAHDIFFSGGLKVSQDMLSAPALALLGAWLCAAPSDGATARHPGVVDTHLHVAPSEAARLSQVLDSAGVAWGVNLSGGWPGGGLEEQLEVADRSGRLLVACTLPWRAAAKYPDFPQIAVALLRHSVRLGARALKVPKGLGLGFRNHRGALLVVDDATLDPIWQVAAELGIPVVIHTADPKAFWAAPGPENERHEELTAHPGWSNYGVAELPSFHTLLDQLMRVVARHPRTRFVSVHFGNNAEEPAWVDAALTEHQNLFIDLAARLPEFGRHPPEQMRKLFIRHADRILFATDLAVIPGGVILGSSGRAPNAESEVGPFFEKHWAYLETSRTNIPSPTPIQGRWEIKGLSLPAPVLRKIYRDNALKVFGLPPRPVGPR